jgi:hypothetical protein
MLRGRGFHRMIHQYFLCKCRMKGKSVWVMIFEEKGK